MNTSKTSASPHAITCDMLAVPVTDDLARAWTRWEPVLGPGLAELAETRGFTGRDGTSLVVSARNSKVRAREVLFLGTAEGALDAPAAARAGRIARTHRVRHLAIDLSGNARPGLAVESVAAGNYAYDRFKRESDRTPPLEALTLIEAGPHDQAATDIRIRAQEFAREITNHPPAELYPETLADAARTLASLDHVEVEVWDEHRLEAEGCVGILAVGQGSTRPPRLIRVSYRPPGATAHVALVGKGITFDTGGYSLKPSASMQTMRCDMGGAAAVLGATRVIAELGLPVAVDTFVGAAENVISGNAYKLSDVLTYSNGVTVEIHNTDAEGRLVLADCLIRACAIPTVTHVVDVATLTGAAVVAVGPDFSGLFTHDDGLAGALLGAAGASGEGLWRLPLHKPYAETLKADWAQIKNVGGKDAGATTAALFLSYFVTDKVKWAHLDIAGPAFLDKANGCWAAGATGQPTRTLASWVASFAGG